MKPWKDMDFGTLMDNLLTAESLRHLAMNHGIARTLLEGTVKNRKEILEEINSRIKEQKEK